ncbi:DnaB-like helicase N-terminal domain-containing protein [Trujillonella endophytica]|uniref:DnaB-like helicase N terminal domain-containing protein n=1 Tax=Trujillonella endophytica TaxID=673521 RepID=A0A1H8UHZ0_9ACTN|nr:DnaB-like helicase N-terminal domain-containing protein [Trujillella endophytica]SEP02805.1 DnaB-like helicase N terminal domain-containing protein [Trujillella endophytica]
MNDNARLERVQTGAVTNMPGGQVHGTATYGLDAESAFVGAVLHMPAPLAGQALDLVHDDDLGDYMHGLIVTTMRRLVAERIAPDPAVVLARARADGIVTGSVAVSAFALRLAELFGSVPTPASWRSYALGTIDDALRRSCIALGDRVRQAAEGSALDVMVDILDAECRTVRRLLNRRDGLSGHAPTLRAVSA